MKLHEYQAKEMLAKYGVPVNEGYVADTPDEVEHIARRVGKRPHCMLRLRIRDDAAIIEHDYGDGPT